MVDQCQGCGDSQAHRQSRTTHALPPVLASQVGPGSAPRSKASKCSYGCANGSAWIGPGKGAAAQTTPEIEFGPDQRRRRSGRNGRNSSAEIPPTAPIPVCPWMLTGCSAMVLFEPPNRALAPTPTPSVALADAPR